VDLSLDTYPYNGTTTLCESLSMGVPVVSLVGDRTVSRMGLTILKAVELEELAAKSEEDYVRIVAGLVQDTARLDEIRRGLGARFEATLGDEAGFAERFERVVEGLWAEWQRGG